MKPIFRYIILTLSSLLLAVLGLNTLSMDNLLSDILSENPGYKIAIIAIIFVGYLAMYLITTQIISFIYCLFFKIATKDKEMFDLKTAQNYAKASITLLIMLHVICFGLQLLTTYVVYAVVYITIGFVIVCTYTHSYKKRKNSAFNIYVALIPQIAYVVGNVVYAYFNF